MNIGLWIVQGLLAFAFVYSGGMKVFAYEKYTQMIHARSGQPMHFSRSFMTFIGICELAGGLGLILPMLLGIAPVLTPLAAAGLAIIMAGAAVVHLRRREPAAAPIVLFVLAAVVVYGRFAA